ncbi:hypothetical protein PM022_18640 [Halorubrum ezzemoulense]|uniref:hypothetical protein n=1 Tax=Halorubrum ezzemoulense TaxID=337243 RepID=UPI00232A9F26|nr:hypothetical protein [Halorubrum ezzemoulense]MDB2276507.1 hypothetical protein [Halorubrum ezzemoulense]
MILQPDIFREDRLPQTLVHREPELAQFSRALKPALQGERPDNLLSSGPSGIRKRTLTRLFLDNPRSPTNLDSTILRFLGETTGSGLRDAIDAHRAMSPSTAASRPTS